MHTPLNKITDWCFVDAHSGDVKEQFQMREFYEWNREARQYLMVRHYQLIKEDELNPKREGLQDK